jgi:hypothetical protein
MSAKCLQMLHSQHQLMSGSCHSACLLACYVQCAAAYHSASMLGVTPVVCASDRHHCMADFLVS